MITLILYIIGIYFLIVAVVCWLGNISVKEARDKINTVVKWFFTDTDLQPEIMDFELLAKEEWHELELRLEEYFNDVKLMNLCRKDGVVHIEFSILGIRSRFAQMQDALQESVTFDIEDFFISKLGKEYPIHIQTCNTQCLHILVAYNAKGQEYLKQIAEVKKCKMLERRQQTQRKLQLKRLKLKEFAIEHADELLIGFRYREWKENKALPVRISLKTHPHLLLSGSSGSGKSYALTMYIFQFMYKCAQYDIWLGDFKNSGRYEFVKKVQNAYYAVGNGVEVMVDDYYQLFCDVRDGIKTISKNQILILDEYMAWMQMLEMTDKKKEDKYKNIIGTLLMMGRDVKGVTFGVIIVVQRPDAVLFPKGARDNFMTAVALGTLSAEAKTMLTDQTGSIPATVYGRGEGVARIDGSDEPVTEIMIPKII
mgnify:CR=1 FL=1